MKHLMLACLCVWSIAVQASEIKLRPGLWELSYQPESGDGGEAAGLRLGGATINVRTLAFRYCMTPEQAEHSEPPRPRDSDKMKCDTPEYKRTGNTLRWKIVCHGERSMSGSGTLVISSAEAYAGSTRLAGQDKKHGDVTLNTRLQGKWLAEQCEPK